MATPTGAHLVGSVPLDSASDVFTSVCAALGRHVRRLLDGETGPRALWISFQLNRLARLPWFEMVAPVMEGAPPTLRLKDGISAGEVEFGELGYAEAAAASWLDFDRLPSEGVIASDVLFQVSMPTPLANTWAWFGTDPQFGALHERYTVAFRNEVGRLLSELPNDRIAVQWDVCVEVWLYEGWVPAQASDARELCVAHVAEVAGWVPDDVDLGFHLCYGDWQHEHLRQPDDVGNVVSLVNGLLARVRRPVSYVRIPVPIERDDDAYFAPLRDLAVPEGCELYLGLVHYRDGEEGARRRVAAAMNVVPSFGVATECGMGRRPEGRGGTEDELRRLLDIHAAVAAPIR
jgi:hypothetical protein